MANISRSEFLSNIRGIINESMSSAATDFDGSEKFGIRRYVSGLVEEGNKNPKLMTYLLNYDKSLNEGAKDFMLFAQFGQGLGQFAKGNRSVKAVLEQMNNTLEASGNELETYMVIEKIQQPYVKKVISEAYNNYLADKTPETMTNLIDSLDLLYEQAPAIAQKLNVLITEEKYCTLEPFGNYMNESAFEELSRKMAKDNEDKKIKAIQEKIEDYANSVFDKAIQEEREAKVNFTLNGIANSNGIGLNEAIKNIASSDAKVNKRLMETLDEYACALTNGAYEERLYETFVSNLQKYTYLVPVEEAIKTVTDNVEKNSLPIMITKILEEMSETMSYYLVPLIEEDCARFVKEPNPTNRVQMRNALVAHAADPYVYAMLEAIDRDDTRSMNSITEKAMSIKDQIKMIRQNASVTNLYSPVQYIKENECVFNANGQFYVKKGNTLSKLDEAYIPQLSEKFIELCQLVNDPRVVIDEDKIILATNDKVAYIFEGYVDINGTRESRESLRDLQAMCMKYDYDTNFYIMCSCLHENFNNIAKINFAKHVSLNENRGINLDLFRLGDNIFINTVNEAVSQSTFYRDVNPIQCKNIINSHMGLNVSNLFEDLIPSQEKIIMRLNETQDAYQQSIEKYECTIEKLKKASNECNSEENKKKLDDAIKTATEKVDALKKEYKEWQKSAKDATSINDAADDDEEVEDDDTRIETNSEPIDGSDVDDAMSDLTSPIDSEDADAADDEEVDSVSDDEFDSYLNADESSDEDVIPELPVDGEPVDEPTDDELENEPAEDEPAIEEPTEEPAGDEDVILDGSDALAGDTFDDMIPEVTPDDVDADADGNIEAQINDMDADTEIPVVGDEPVEEPVEEPTDDTEDFTTTDDLTAEENPEENPDEATDMFGGDTRDPLAVNAEEPDMKATAKEDTYKIANVMFDENIKTGEKYKSGTVTVVVPMIQGDGKRYIDNQTYDFYINNEGNTVIDNEEMTVELYNAICDAIKNDSLYNIFVEEGVSKEDDEIETEDDTNLTFNDDDDQWSVSFDEPEDDVTVTETPDDRVKVDVPSDEEVVLDTPAADEVNVTETPDGKEVSLDSIFSDFMNGSDDESSKETVIAPSYKSGDTEIELPAPTADGTDIPDATEEDADEVRRTREVKESRKSLISIRPVYEKNGHHFFLNEGTIKPSKKGTKKDAPLACEKIDGGIAKTSSSINEFNQPIEDYVEDTAESVFQLMYDKAEYSKIALKSFGHIVKVTPIESEEDDVDIVEYFTIEDLGSISEVKSYTVYTMRNRVYYRPSDEFYQIIQDIDDKVPGATLDLLRKEYNKRKLLPSISMVAKDDCVFLINSIIQSLTGEVVVDNNSRAVNLMTESCKIRKPSLKSTKLPNGADFENSKLADDIQHGDKEQRDFEKDIEAKTQKDGVPNPLTPAPEQEESAEPKLTLPNAHRLSEQYEIEYEPMDNVIYNDVPAQVLTVSEDGESISILCQGHQIDVKHKDLEPDPKYLSDLGNTVQQFDFDDNKLTKAPQNEKPAKMQDLNGKTVTCNVIVDGHKINMYECYASLEDIVDSKRKLRVITESGSTEEFDAGSLEFTDKPYAVIVDGEDKPVRRIQVEPTSYIDADDDEMVDCYVNGKTTQFPKKVIKILS